MKYTLIALAAVTLMTGAASAGQDISKWHCVGLKANWQNAPQLQCPRVFVETRTQPVAPSIPTPPPPREEEPEIVPE